MVVHNSHWRVQNASQGLLACPIPTLGTRVPVNDAHSRSLCADWHPRPLLNTRATSPLNLTAHDEYQDGYLEDGQDRGLVLRPSLAPLAPRSGA